LADGLEGGKGVKEKGERGLAFLVKGVSNNRIQI
jgi:hypothetical protein